MYREFLPDDSNIVLIIPIYIQATFECLETRRVVSWQWLTGNSLVGIQTIRNSARRSINLVYTLMKSSTYGEEH